MRRTTRRRLDLLWVALGAMATGGAVAAGALLGDTERIADYWLHARLGLDTATVVEVIDYDFGSGSRRGILRDIPDLEEGDVLEVSSPTAPASVEFDYGRFGLELRIGDPLETVSNRHRYRIAYEISTISSARELSWDAIGTGWTIPIGRARIHVTSGTRFESVTCSRGAEGSIGGCEARQVEPGHLVVDVEGLGVGEGVTLRAVRGSAVAEPLSPQEPVGPADDPGAGWPAPAIAAAVSSILAAGLVSSRARVMGREQVWAGGPADAAFGPGPGPGDTAAVRLADHVELAEMATIEFESPRDLSAAAGGIVHAESVEPQHQTAWLVECAIRGEVVLEGDSDDVTVRRGPEAPHPAVKDRLDDIFGAAGDSGSIELGEYDERFAQAWERLRADLDEWRRRSGLWDPVGESRRKLARVGGVLALGIGGAAAIVGGVLANRSGLLWMPLIVVGALVSGAGLAGLVRSWELPIRTPQGSARWLQVESFRRFIEASEARHAEAAARMGLLRQYTAWAVALDELDHWEDVVRDAASVPGSAAAGSRLDWRFPAVAHALSGATKASVTAPSSSGSGGGGSVGGGGGGGGGGSW